MRTTAHSDTYAAAVHRIKSAYPAAYIVGKIEQAGEGTMKIRNSAEWEEDGKDLNTFVAVDELENRLGKCRVVPSYVGELIPERPMEYKISVESAEPAIRQQLLGTAFSRAMMLADRQDLDARIYAECRPDDEQMLSLFSSIGMIDNDALIEMNRAVVGGANLSSVPDGCIFIVDDLSSQAERNYFVERQTRLFGRENAAAWTEELLKKQGMRRLLLANREGLVGEAVCYIGEDGCGVIEEVYTVPAWRRRGVATFLMEEARRYFFENGLNRCRLNVRIKMTAMTRTAASLGYRRSNIILRLPGSNLDAPKVKRRK